MTFCPDIGCDEGEQWKEIIVIMLLERRISAAYLEINLFGLEMRWYLLPCYVEGKSICRSVFLLCEDTQFGSFGRLLYPHIRPTTWGGRSLIRSSKTSDPYLKTRFMIFKELSSFYKDKVSCSLSISLLISWHDSAWRFSEERLILLPISWYDSAWRFSEERLIDSMPRLILPTDETDPAGFRGWSSQFQRLSFGDYLCDGRWAFAGGGEEGGDDRWWILCSPVLYAIFLFVLIQSIAIAVCSKRKNDFLEDLFILICIIVI